MGVCEWAVASPTTTRTVRPFVLRPHVHTIPQPPPGVEEDSIIQIEANLSDLKEKYGSLDPGQLFSGAKPLTPYKLVKELLYGLGVSTAAETLPQYKCTCSEEKVFRALKVRSCWGVLEMAGTVDTHATDWDGPSSVLYPPKAAVGGGDRRHPCQGGPYRGEV